MLFANTENSSFRTISTDGICLSNPETYPPSKEEYEDYLTVDDRIHNAVARKNPGEPMLVAMARHSLSPEFKGLI